MNAIQTITNVSEVDSDDWKYVLEVDQPLKGWESDINVKLTGKALAFYEAIKANGVITLTKAADIEDYIDFVWASTWVSIPDNGIVCDEEHARITGRFENGFDVKLEDAALVEFDSIMKSWYAEIASNYEPENYPVTKSRDLDELDWKIAGVTAENAQDVAKLRDLFEAHNNVVLADDAWWHFEYEALSYYAQD